MTKEGLVKPYDPSPIMKKLETLRKEGHDTSELEKCCPTSSEVRDAKDFKPYINAALEQLSKIMQLEVRPYYGN